MKIENRIFHRIFVGVCIVIFLSGCGPGQLLGPTITPTPTLTQTPLPTNTFTPTQTPTPTPIPPTLTYTPSPTIMPTSTNTPAFLPTQHLLLRPKCGSSYTIQSGQNVEVFYGSWGVKGKDLANQWASVLKVTLAIDGQFIGGKLQAVSGYLPYNCTSQTSDTYWLYYRAVIPALSPGAHTANVIYSSSTGLSDGVSGSYGPGQFLENSFMINVN